MSPTRKEIKALAQQYAPHLSRMRDCLNSVDHQDASDDELVRAWFDYSDSLCAQWLGLPDDDTELLNILRKHLPQARTFNTIPILWQAKILDAGDGSCDGILELPDELLSQLRWDLGDELVISASDTGELVLRKTEG